MRAKDLTKKARGYAGLAIEILCEIMEDPEAANRERIKAAEVLLERAYGRVVADPNMSDHLKDSGGEKLEITVLPTAKIKAV